MLLVPPYAGENHMFVTDSIYGIPESFVTKRFKMQIWKADETSKKWDRGSLVVPLNVTLEYM